MCRHQNAGLPPPGNGGPRNHGDGKTRSEIPPKKAGLSYPKPGLKRESQLVHIRGPRQHPLNSNRGLGEHPSKTTEQFSRPSHDARLDSRPCISTARPRMALRQVRPCWTAPLTSYVKVGGVCGAPSHRIGWLIWPWARLVCFAAWLISSICRTRLRTQRTGTTIRPCPSLIEAIRSQMLAISS